MGDVVNDHLTCFRVNWGNAAHYNLSVKKYFPHKQVWRDVKETDSALDQSAVLKKPTPSIYSLSTCSFLQMTSNDLNLCWFIVKVLALQILSFACQIKVWSFVYKSRYVSICDYFFTLATIFLKIFHLKHPKIHLSLFLLQDSWYWSTSNSSVPLE